MRSREEMRAAFARFEDSGLTLKAFGEREGITYTTLQYWRRKLRDLGGDKATGGGERADPVVWSPVRVVRDGPTSAEATGFEVWLTNGVSLEVRSGFDESELRRLVGVLSTC